MEWYMVGDDLWWIRMGAVGGDKGEDEEAIWRAWRKVVRG